MRRFLPFAALLGVALVLGCQDMAPVGPDGLVPQFDKKEDGRVCDVGELRNGHCHDTAEQASTEIWTVKLVRDDPPDTGLSCSSSEPVSCDIFSVGSNIGMAEEFEGLYETDRPPRAVPHPMLVPAPVLLPPSWVH